MSVSPYTQSSAHWPKRAEGEITRRRTHGTNESQEGKEGEGRLLFFRRSDVPMQRWVGRSVGRWFPEGEGKSQRKRGKKGEGGAWLERERERRGKEEEKGERRTMPPPPSGRRSTHGPTDRAGLMHAEEERERGFGRRREWKEKLVLREGRGMHREGGGQQRLWRKKGGRGYKRYGARRGGGASERGPKGGGERPSLCPPPWFLALLLV